MAKKNGMKSQFLAKKDPEYKRVEQYRCSDIDFLSQLCHDAGLSLKCTDGKLVIFDQKEYEGKDSAWTVTKDDKSYIKWSHTLGQAGTQYASCRVSYVGPNGKPIEGIAYVKDYDAKSKPTSSWKFMPRSRARPRPKNWLPKSSGCTTSLSVRLALPTTATRARLQA